MQFLGPLMQDLPSSLVLGLFRYLNVSLRGERLLQSKQRELDDYNASVKCRLLFILCSKSEDNRKKN